jgi:hypothetical protein
MFPISHSIIKPRRSKQFDDVQRRRLYEAADNLLPGADFRPQGAY